MYACSRALVISLYVCVHACSTAVILWWGPARSSDPEGPSLNPRPKRRSLFFSFFLRAVVPMHGRWAAPVYVCLYVCIVHTCLYVCMPICISFLCFRFACSRAHAWALGSPRTDLQVRPTMRPCLLRRQLMRCSVALMPARLSASKLPTCTV